MGPKLKRTWHFIDISAMLRHAIMKHKYYAYPVGKISETPHW